MRPVRLAPCAAGARPTMAIRARGSPKPATGRPQYSSDANAARFSRATSSRHSTSRGQRRHAPTSAASVASALSRRLCVVRRGALILSGLCLAVGAGGCSVGSSTASSGSFTGVKGQVAVALNLFASDSSSNNAKDMCTNVLGKTVIAKLDKVGGCPTVITNQLKTVNDFTLTIRSIKVTGKTATAVVQTVQSRVKVLRTVVLTHETAGWRLDSVAS